MVQHQIKNVQQVQAGGGAFVAILADGSVVTWGDQRFAVTAPESKMSSGMCSRFRQVWVQVWVHLLQSWLMDQSLHGAFQDAAVIAPESKTSSNIYSMFRPHIVHLLQSRKMDQSFVGAIHRLVDGPVIALDSFKWPPCDMGAIQCLAGAWTLRLRTGEIAELVSWEGLCVTGT